MSRYHVSRLAPLWLPLALAALVRATAAVAGFDWNDDVALATLLGSICVGLPLGCGLFIDAEGP